MKTRSRQTGAWLWPNLDFAILLNFPEYAPSDFLIKTFNLDDSLSSGICGLRRNNQSNKTTMRICKPFHLLLPKSFSLFEAQVVQCHEVTAVGGAVNKGSGGAKEFSGMNKFARLALERHSWTGTCKDLCQMQTMCNLLQKMAMPTVTTSAGPICGVCGSGSSFGTSYASR